MERTERASIWFLRVLAAACQAHGLEASEVLVAAGLEPELLERRDGRVPLDRARAAWDQAAKMSGDPLFGLHAAEKIPAGGLDVLDYLGRSMASLGKMLARVSELGSILTEDGAVVLETGPQRALLRHRARKAVAHVSDLMFAGIVLRGRQFTGVDWAPRAVNLMHAAPADAAEYERIFRVPVKFDQPADELHIPNALLELPLSTYEPQLAAILDDYVQRVAGSRLSQPGVLSDVDEAIAAALPSGEPRLEDVARSLCVTPRTLQRRLKDAGTTFQTLLDGLRHRLALQYLEDGELPTAKLALLLGFSEPSAFYRAYKRWTGKSPARSK